MEIIDPVCKMTIKEEDAAGKSTCDIFDYYFCSKTCKEKFDEDRAPALNAAWPLSPPSLL